LIETPYSPKNWSGGNSFPIMADNSLGAMWRWWTGELIGLVPRTDPRRDVNRATAWELFVSPDGYQVYRRQRLDKPLSSKRLIASGPAIEDLVKHVSSRTAITLTFDARLCLTRLVPVPQAALARINDILDVQSATLNPFPNHKPLSFYRTTTKIEPDLESIEHALLNQGILTRVESALSAAGISTAAILIRSEGLAAWPVAKGGMGATYGVGREALEKPCRFFLDSSRLERLCFD
jgi:hypothetical protein